ncbi:7005_t:CDS:2, partial [Acaulospora morrowiae]
VPPPVFPLFLHLVFRRLRKRLNDIDNHIDTLTAQELKGSTFLKLTRDDLSGIQVPLGPAKEIVELINDIQGEK